MKEITPFTVNLTEMHDRGEAVLVYLSEDLGCPLLFILKKDLERPEIAISLVEAAIFLDPEVFEDVKYARIGMRDFFTFGHEGNFDWTNWCIAVRVETTLGEIRETCWDTDLREWVAPWFDLDTGHLNKD